MENFVQPFSRRKSVFHLFLVLLRGASLVLGGMLFFSPPSEGGEFPEAPLLEEKSSETLWTIGVPTNYPPLFFTDPHRSPEGAAIEIYEAIFGLLKEPVMFVLVDDWEEALAVLTEAGVDAISNLGVLERNAQSKGLLLSDPIEEFDVRLFFRRGEKPFSSRKDLVQRVLGVVRHTSVEEYLRQARAQTIVTYRTIPDLVFALLSGEIEAAVCEEGLFEGVARQAGIDDRIFSYGFSLMKSRFRFVLSPGEEEKLAFLNRGILRFRSSLEYDRLKRNWYIEKEYWDGEAILSSAGILVGGAFLLLFYLRYQEKKRMNEVLEQSRKRLDAQYNCTPSPTFTWLTEGEGFRLFKYNDAAAIFERDQSKLYKGKPLEEVFPDSSRVVRLVERCFSEKALVEGEHFYRDGQGGHLILSLRCVFVPPDLVLMHANDITLQKEIRQKEMEYQYQLQALASSLSRAEERERRRIATVIHDSIGQNLALAKIRAVLLGGDYPNSAVFREMQNMVDLLDDTIKTVRSLTFDLGSPVLYKLGFVPAAEWLGEKLLEDYGLEVHLENRGFPETVNDDLKAFLFRSLSELLMNIIKHAETDRAWVICEEPEKGVLALSVIDEGKGFSPERLDFLKGAVPSFGIFSLQERLKHLRGALDIFSEPSRGTRVVLTVSSRAFEED